MLLAHLAFSNQVKKVLRHSSKLWELRVFLHQLSHGVIFMWCGQLCKNVRLDEVSLTFAHFNYGAGEKISLRLRGDFRKRSPSSEL